MAENGSLPYPSSEKINKKPTSFLRLLNGLTNLKGITETEVSVISPTSILDISKPISVLKTPFRPELPNTQHSPNSKTSEPGTRHKLELESKGGLGCLGIVEVMKDENQDQEEPKPEKRMVLFGSQLKIQIRPLVPSVISPQDSPKGPTEFGIKTRNQLSSSFSSVTPNSPQVFTGCLSATEMELSEDYTCVVSHGPNPKTTHIFDNSIVETCCGVVGFSSLRKGSSGSMASDRLSYPSESFLSLCYNCKKNLGPGKDVYMYRGEKAFCSRECRFQEMMLEEGMDKLDPDDAYGTCS